MGEATTKPYRILYRKTPAWLVGEEDINAVVRRNFPDVSLASERYPNDYSGIVISVIPLAKSYHAGDLAGAGRAQVVLDLTPEQLAAARSRQLKVINDKLEAVTFNDRWGAVAAALWSEFGSGVEAIEQLPDDDPAKLVFARRAIELQRALPKTITHSGAGMYLVGTSVAISYTVAFIQLGSDSTIVWLEAGELTPGAHVGEKLRFAATGNWYDIIDNVTSIITLDGTEAYYNETAEDTVVNNVYSTIQSALDQLWTDQGSAVFTANQFIRIFADTYDETISPNGLLNQDELNGYTLIIEGDAGDDRNNIIVQPSTSYALYALGDTIIVRHLRFVGNAAAFALYIGAFTRAEISDCYVSSGNTRDAIYAAPFALTVEDCEISTGNRGIFITGTNRAGIIHIRRCQITRNGAKTDEGVRSLRGLIIDGCVLRGFADGIYLDADYQAPIIRNCTFYDCTNSIRLLRATDVEMVNNIFDSCTYPLRISCWPDEAGEGEMGGPFILRNNCFYNYTGLVYDGWASKRYAQFAAFDRVDASDDLDATNPLLTNPAGGDFSLQSGSPCLTPAGHGSGVIKGYNGVAFNDPPDIGAWSSGPAPGGGGQQTRYLLEEA